MHSPLPPPLPATLEIVASKVDHAITVIEVMARHLERMDEERAEARVIEASMRKIALRLSSAGVAMATARVVSAVAAPSRALGALAFGAFAGGFVGTIVWQLVHARAALAGFLP